MNSLHARAFLETVPDAVTRAPLPVPSTGAMAWELSHRADPRARALADRHYSRQKPGAVQFVPPGRCVVLFARGRSGGAYWVTSWPYAKYVKHAWAGAWICSAFRNEGAGLSSDLVEQAVAATRAVFGEPPSLGFVTFVDRRRVASPNPGYCFKAAGWRRVGETKGGLVALRMAPDAMPAPVPPIGFQWRL